MSDLRQSFDVIVTTDGIMLPGSTRLAVYPS